MNSESVAKTALLSSLLTVCIIGGLFYIFRYELLGYLASQVSSPANLSEQKRSAETYQLSDMIETVDPAVVSVIATKEVPVYERYYERFGSEGIFGGFTIPRVRENGTQRQEVGSGSGFIVSNDGLIVTNRHVVEDVAADYTILLNDGVAYGVEVVAIDEIFDIAILKIAEPLESSLDFVGFGDSDDLKLGQTVVAIGNALGEFRNSVSVGVVSGLSRSIVASDVYGKSEELDQVIQTDAAINPGNSGGPLLNTEGQVIGVNVAVSSGAENIGFALPSNIVKGVVESVREYGEIRRPFLGVRYMMLNEYLAKQYELPYSYGAYVISGSNASEVAVVPGSPAEKAGLIEGMIIISIDGEELREKDLSTIMRSKQVGDTIELVVFIDGQQEKLSVLLDQAL